MPKKIQGNLKKYFKQKATKCTLLHILITKFVIPLYTGTVNKNSAKIGNFLDKYLGGIKCFSDLHQDTKF